MPALRHRVENDGHQDAQDIQDVDGHRREEKDAGEPVLPLHPGHPLPTMEAPLYILLLPTRTAKITTSSMAAMIIEMAEAALKLNFSKAIW